MKTSAARLGNGGFTLIELVIALTIIGLIALLLFSGLRLGGRTWEAVEVIGERFSGLRLADGFLTRTLTQARPAEATFDGATRPVFSGDGERLEFVAPLSEHVGVAGLYILRLTLEAHGADTRLVLTRWYLHPEVLEGGDDFPPWEPLLENDTSDSLADLPLDMDAADGAFGRAWLLGDVRLFELAYYGQIDGDTEPDWHAEWLEQTRLPQLVRIRLETSTQSWPDLVAPLPSQP
jgi:general secretion pathway protein J